MSPPPFLVHVGKDLASPPDGAVSHAADQIALGAMTDAELDDVIAAVDAARAEVVALKGPP